MSAQLTPMEGGAWIPLPDDQADFFRSQLDAASGMAFSSEAHAAGIIPINAGRTKLDTGNGLADLLVWSDPSRAYTTCIFASDTRPNMHTRQFVTVEQAEDLTTVEGVGISVGSVYSRDSSIYGRVVLAANEEEQEYTDGEQAQIMLQKTALRFGLSFFDASHAHSLDLNAGRPLADILQLTHNRRAIQPSIVGIDNITAARVFRSINSLSSIITVAGDQGEVSPSTTATYEFARAALKAYIIGANNSQGAEGPKRQFIYNNRGQARGAAATTDSDITAVYRHGSTPDRISVVFAARPQAEGPFFAERHVIQPTKVWAEVAVLEEAYTVNSIVQHFDNADLRQDRSRHLQAPLESPAQRLLQQRIVRMLVETVDADT